MTEMTKQLLADALRGKMQTKPLNKITIKEIAEECSLNRQTFYYHFPDIYGLLEWMFQRDAEKLMRKYNSVDVWEQGMTELLEYIRRNREVCMCTLHSVARDQLEYFVFKDVRRLILSVIDEVGGDLNLPMHGRDFVADFYTYAICAVVVHWMKDGMKESSECLIDKLRLTMQGNIRLALERFAKEK